MGTRHKHADVIIAWANGEEIEYKWHGEWHDWDDNSTPLFYEDCEYRIKPKGVKKEGWIALYHKDSEGFPACCGIYATQDECQRMNRTGRIVHIEWEEEE